MWEETGVWEMKRGDVIPELAVGLERRRQVQVKLRQRPPSQI